MPDDVRVLVVGTTPDYIQWIDQTWPGRALFLTDAVLRHAATEPAPDAASELRVDLRDVAGVDRRLNEHMRHHDVRLGGITCFDCECMSLAARLAESFRLPYPSPQAVANCRDKLRCKQLWRNARVPCPEARIIATEAEARAFLAETGGACVLKPLQGAGSEWVFLCHRPDDLARALREIRRGLERQQGSLLYGDGESRILAEAYIGGPEYSCDVLLEEDRLVMIRLARKVLRQAGAFGTVQGYLVPADLPEGLRPGELEALLARAARALGLSAAICMVDFIIGPDGPMLLEMAPRPGGDCLPALIRHAGAVDMLGITLDRAEGRDVTLPPLDQWRRCVGLRLFARREGILEGVDTSRVQADPRTLEVYLKRRSGHRVALPPQDYDAWLLGHLIFSPRADSSVESQCDELLDAVRISMVETHERIDG